MKIKASAAYEKSKVDSEIRRIRNAGHIIISVRELTIGLYKLFTIIYEDRSMV